MVDWGSFLTPAQLLAGIVLVAITSITFYRTKAFPMGGIIVTALGFALLALPVLESMALGPDGLTIQIREIVEEEVAAATGDLRADVEVVFGETALLTSDVRELYEQAELSSAVVTEVRDWAATVVRTNPSVLAPPTFPDPVLPENLIDERIRDLRLREDLLRDFQLTPP